MVNKLCSISCILQYFFRKSVYSSVSFLHIGDKHCRLFHLSVSTWKPGGDNVNLFRISVIGLLEINYQYSREHFTVSFNS